MAQDDDDDDDYDYEILWLWIRILDTAGVQDSQGWILVMVSGLVISNGWHNYAYYVAGGRSLSAYLRWLLGKLRLIYGQLVGWLNSSDYLEAH